MKSRLDSTRDFAEFLTLKDHSLPEVLNFLVRVILAPLSIDSAIYFQGNSSGKFTQVAISGLSELAKKELHSIYSLSEELPAAYAIQTGDFVWIDSSNKREDDYPLIEDYKEVVGNKTLIVVPVWVDKTPDGSIALTSKKNIKETPELKVFLRAIASILSLYYHRKVTISDEDNSPTSHDVKTTTFVSSNELTERQRVILRLISEERTNQSISEFLGYSESTIRQEIMRIFDKLGCSHRSEAAALYKGFN